MLKNTKKIKWYKTLSFPKFVSFYHLSVPQGLRISKIFFAILYIYYGKVLTDNRKGFFYLYQNKKDVPKMFQKKLESYQKNDKFVTSKTKTCLFYY